MHRDDYRQTLFQTGEVLDVDGFSLQEAHNLYESAYGPVPWLIAGKQK
ncbi:MAG: hypothetical protein M0Z31_01745 [Clostridia bacterium]|nr:hypothetical protein [Clostridia bacterium]